MEKASLKEMGGRILDAASKPPKDEDNLSLLDSGDALKVLGFTLQHIVAKDDKDAAKKSWESTGLQLEAFQKGFSQVFSYSSLKAFNPDELVMLFGRTQEDWNIETLMESVKADHGFNMDSKSVKNLLQTMSLFIGR